MSTLLVVILIILKWIIQCVHAKKYHEIFQLDDLVLIGNEREYQNTQF